MSHIFKQYAVVILFFLFFILIPPFPTATLQKQIQNSWGPLFEKVFTYNGQTYRITPEGKVFDISRDTFLTNRTLHGEILALALFYKASMEDPLLYSPHLNTENWNITLDKLTHARGEFFTARENNLQDKRRVDRMPYRKITQNPESIYPFEFLKLFITAAELQDLFLQKPSDTLAKKIIKKQKEAQKAYKKSAVGHLAQLNMLPESADSKILLFLGSATNVETIRNDFELITQNARALLKDIQLRERCLSFGFCNNIQRAVLHTGKPLSPILLSEKENFKIPLELITPPRTREMRGPYIISSNCWTKTFALLEKQWPMYLSISSFEDVKTSLPMLANEIFYWDVRTTPNTTDKERARLGISYNDQVATNTYMCNDNSFHTKIMTLSYLEHIVKSSGVITKAEKYLLRPYIPSDELLPILSKEYWAVNTQEATTRRLIVENQLVDFDLILGKLYELMGVYTDITNINKRPFAPRSILGPRSSYSLLYLSFAQSVWRLQEHPQYLLPGIYKHSSRYITFDELIATGFDPHKAKVWDTDVLRQIAEKYTPDKTLKAGGHNFVPFFNLLSNFLKFN